MIITNETNYNLIKRDAVELVRSDTKYPSYVFKRPFRYFYFMEHGVALDVRIVKVFAAKVGDAVIKQMFLNPSAEEFWQKECGHYGAMSVDVNALENQWKENLLDDAGRPGNSMYNWNGTFCHFGNTKHWAVFNDFSFDLSVAGSDIDFSDIEEPYFRKYVHDVEWAVGYWKPFSWMDEEWYDTLRRNYSGLPAQNQ